MSSIVPHALAIWLDLNSTVTAAEITQKNLGHTSGNRKYPAALNDMLATEEPVEYVLSAYNT